MSLSTSTARALFATTIATALLAASGCSMFHHKDGGSWFHRHNQDYQKSHENRPLEVPPDLDTPATDPSMQIPAVRGASSTVNSLSPASNAGMSANADPTFTVADTMDGTWERMGRALERIDGVTVTQRAQVLGTYEVQYKGVTMLLRGVAEGAATRVDAVGPAGKSIRSPEAIELLSLLRARIG
ncbi:MAG: hypothetical protein ABIT64_01925 [Lysobacteraceae bacterium]